MAPRAVPPVALPILSPIQVAPKFRPLAASPSCHSLSHFGASHSAALSSLAPAYAEPIAMTPAKTAANPTDRRNQDIRDGPRLTTRIELPEDADPLHDKVSRERRQQHQSRCPQERRIEVRERQALGVHAENTGDQRRRHQYRGQDRKYANVVVALLLDLQMEFLLQQAAALPHLDNGMVEAVEALGQLAGAKLQCGLQVMDLVLLETVKHDS